MSGLFALASRLTKRVTPVVAGILLALIIGVAGIVEVALASGPAAWIIAGLVCFIVIVLVIVHLIDRPRPSGLDEAEITAVHAILVNVRNAVADSLKCDKERCRANIFHQQKPLKRLQIIKSLWVNMTRIQEWDIPIPVGRGGTGIAWETGKSKVLIAPFKDDEDLDEGDAKRVDPALKWIISAPVIVDSSVTWVLNVDGRDKRSAAKVDAAVQQVEDAATTLAPFAKIASRATSGRRRGKIPT